MTAATDLRYTSAPDRRARLVELVEAQGFCTVSELAAALSVSEMTIRRDVQRFIDAGRLRGVHGGVTALRRHAFLGSDFAARADRMQPAKRAIARRAAQLIEPDSAVGIDAGTTTLELTHALDANPPRTVVTASLPVMAALLREGSPTLVGLGGVLHAHTQSFAGPSTVDAIADIRLDLLFLAASGITDQNVYCANEFDAVVKRAMITVANRVVLLCDASKFDASAMVRICRLSDLDSVVIDADLAPDHLRILRQHVPEVIVVPVQPTNKESP